MKFDDLKRKLLETDKAFRDIYFTQNLPLEISHKVIRERIDKRLTQEALAQKTGTKQSGISRLERGNNWPSLLLLYKIAKALDKKLKVDFVDKETITYEPRGEEITTYPTLVSLKVDKKTTTASHYDFPQLMELVK